MGIGSYYRLVGRVDNEESNTSRQGCNCRDLASTSPQQDRYACTTGAIIGFVAGLIIISVMQLTATNTRIKDTSAWSPALGIFDDSDWYLQRFDGSLRASNRFRGPPSEDIDNAWNDILFPEGGLIRLKQDQLDKINASKYAAQYTNGMGGGYIVGVEVLHQLHCVNMLRQATYMEYYLPRMNEWRDGETLRYHLGTLSLFREDVLVTDRILDHCVDMLRQKVRPRNILALLTVLIQLKSSCAILILEL